MRSHLITAAVAIAAMAVAACLHRDASLSGSRSTAPAESATADRGVRTRDATRAPAERHGGAREISWFQGTFEEAFARPRSRSDCPLLHY